MSQEIKSFRHNFFVLLTGNSVGQLVPFLLAPFIGRLFSPEQLAVQEQQQEKVAVFSVELLAEHFLVQAVLLLYGLELYFPEQFGEELFISARNF